MQRELFNNIFEEFIKCFRPFKRAAMMLIGPPVNMSSIPTCAVCFGDQHHGVEDLVLILLVQDFALAEVRRELRRGDGAAQFVPLALHLLPQRLHLVTRPVFHLSPWKKCHFSHIYIFIHMDDSCR